MRPPTREEINVYDSLDERVAVERFLGKNLEEAEALFGENLCRYTEDLMWMGPVAFRYYRRPFGMSARMRPRAMRTAFPD
jgi:hypothetical protein